ncbi:MAG TPA: type II secretion system F family protein [Candidatus Gastranaerophilales bacterium]|nr:type II secretion system F family protein [Candidatus Gastranaerophilales bacterium]
MSLFDYEALKDGKERVSGKVEANSEKEAREFLRKQNLLPLKLNELGSAKKTVNVKEKTAKKAGKSKKHIIRPLGMRDKIDFTNIMYTFAKSGISLVESLFFLETNAESENIRNLSMEIRRKILGGAGLSEALSKFPSSFDDVYVGLIKAGEESGEFEETLQRIYVLLQKQDKLMSSIISTLAYPVFVMALAILVTIALLTFVFPAFKGMYDSMGSELPIITAIFMAIGLFLKAHWYVIPLIFLSLGFLVYFMFTWDVSRRFLDDLGLKIPVFERFVRFTAIANFIVVLRVAFEAGIPMVDSLMLANYTVRNAVLRDSLKKVIIDVQYGSSLSNSLKKSKVFPGIVMCLLATGEEAGSLTEMLNQTSDYIEEQVDRVVELLSKLFEPFLFLIIGGIVLTLGLSLYLPLFQAYSNIG